LKIKSLQFRQLPCLDADLDGGWIIMSKTDTSICQSHIAVILAEDGVGKENAQFVM